jgi:hypothetical protein
MPISAGPKAQSIHEYSVPLEVSTVASSPSAPGVTFMDSAGMRALVRVLELRSGKSLIVQPSRQVFVLLQLFALTDGALPNVEILEPPPLDDPPVPD